MIQLSALLTCTSVIEVMTKLINSSQDTNTTSASSSNKPVAQHPLIKRLVEELTPYLPGQAPVIEAEQPFAPSFVTVKDFWPRSHGTVPAEFGKLYELLRDYFHSSRFGLHMKETVEKLTPFFQQYPSVNQEIVLSIFQEFFIVEMFHNMTGNDLVQMFGRVRVQELAERTSSVSVGGSGKFRQEKNTILLIAFKSRLPEFINNGGCQYFVTIFAATECLVPADYELGLKYIRQEIFKKYFTQLITWATTIAGLRSLLTVLNNDETQQLLKVISGEQYIALLPTVDDFINIVDVFNANVQRQQFYAVIPKPHYVKLFPTADALKRAATAIQVKDSNSQLTDLMAKSVAREVGVKFEEAIPHEHYVRLSATAAGFKTCLQMQPSDDRRRKFLDAFSTAQYIDLFPTMEALLDLQSKTELWLFMMVIRTISKQHIDSLMPTDMSEFKQMQEHQGKNDKIYSTILLICSNDIERAYQMTTTKAEYDWFSRQINGNPTKYRDRTLPTLTKFEKLQEAYKPKTSANNNNKNDDDTFERMLWALAKCDESADLILKVIQQALQTQIVTTTPSSQTASALLCWPAVGLNANVRSNNIKDTDSEDLVPLMSLQHGNNGLSDKTAELVKNVVDFISNANRGHHLLKKKK